MNTGMLWQDKAPVAERVQHAVAYYQEKYGRKPDTAFVNPRLLSDHQLEVDGVQVLSMRLPITLLWIGVEDATAPAVQLLGNPSKHEGEQLLEQMEMAL